MYLKILKISQIIKQKTINFTELVKNSNSILSLNLQSKIVDNLNEIFSDQEQHWYIANLYMYMNYHQLDDFIVNLDNVWKFIGFSNKANAKRLLKHNFLNVFIFNIISSLPEPPQLDFFFGRNEDL